MISLSCSILSNPQKSLQISSVNCMKEPSQPFPEITVPPNLFCSGIASPLGNHRGLRTFPATDMRNTQRKTSPHVLTRSSLPTFPFPFPTRCRASHLCERADRLPQLFDQLHFSPAGSDLQLHSFYSSCDRRSFSGPTACARRSGRCRRGSQDPIASSTKNWHRIGSMATGSTV
jgi:hypothetical protein